ncbi:MAG: insulinase family protein [Gammaproteobacteria bacterium]|nr:insulinase family protein [Gammaproteobacteria bacterium]NIR97396.1 insulinase family protein [Gammaproteobacteria bacterium]NIT63049.1 insulinase family protein [Gammaproteobacteria bacterium]NIV20011.1 insulinase family protein [Gammaproteobacteria bacterium]NIX10087.1 insulinase family protein [Gammaproteobacteria bacterium]
MSISPLSLRATLLFWLFALAVPLQAAPNIQHWRTDNGARVYFVPAGDLPVVDVRVVFAAGAVRDGDRPGLATLTNHMLMFGAGDWDADAIARRFEAVGARTGAGAKRDMAWVSMRSLSDPQLLDPAVETLARVLGEPSFPKKDLARERERRLVALEQEKEAPDRLARRAFYRAVFGDHPYAHSPLGTAGSVKRLAREDLVRFYERFYAAGNAVVAIVGDLDRDRAKALAVRLTAGLPEGEAPPPLPPVQSLDEARTVRIEHPSTQTHVLIGQPGMARGDRDYFSLYVGNHALGGSGLVSRISEEVREKRGLSYSAYSYFAPMERKGPFAMGMQTRNEQTEEGIRVLRQTLEHFVAEGIGAGELEATKKNITGGFPLRIDSNREIAEYLAMIGFYELPLDYLNTFIERVESVTRQDVQDAFARRVHPERMVTVIVGGESAGR